jgi:hypothetical protein
MTSPHHGNWPADAGLKDEVVVGCELVSWLEPHTAQAARSQMAGIVQNRAQRLKKNSLRLRAKQKPL